MGNNQGMPRYSLDKRQSDLLHTIYAAARDLERWPGVLAQIAGYFDDYGANLFWLAGNGSVRIIHSPSMALGAVEYAEKWAHRDVRAQRAIAASYHTSRLAIAVSNIMTPEEMDTEPFFTDFLYKYNLKDVAATFLSPRPDNFVGLSVHRLRSKPDFTASELESLGEIGRHVENALYLAIELHEARLQGMGDGFDGIDVAVIGVDSDARAVFANRSARSLLDTLGEGGVERLIAAAKSERGLSTSKIDPSASETGSARNSQYGRARVYFDEVIKQRLLIRSMPLPRPLEASVFGHADYLLMVTPMLGNRAVDQSLVRDAFALSAAEARLASALAMGLSLDEAALQCGITKETARTVLKRVFTKTNTSRQHELVALLRDLRL